MSKNLMSFVVLSGKVRENAGWMKTFFDVLKPALFTPVCVYITSALLLDYCFSTWKCVATLKKLQFFRQFTTPCKAQT